MWEPVNRDCVRKALAQTGATYAEWSEGWDTSPCEWWYLCCDDGEYDTSSLRSDPRKVRRGLARCEVNRIDPGWFAQNGYAVYHEAFNRYGIRPPLSEEGFVQEFTKHARYPGRETWGAFVDGRLVAWVSCLVIGDAVQTSSSKSDPTFFKALPNEALIYVLTRHYLRERNLKYVCAGRRVLMHNTGVQEFQEKLGYRKVYARLRVELSWKASFISALHPQLWAHHLIPGRFSEVRDGLSAFASLVEISRSCV